MSSTQQGLSVKKEVIKVWAKKGGCLSYEPELCDFCHNVEKTLTLFSDYIKDNMPEKSIGSNEGARWRNEVIEEIFEKLLGGLNAS